MRRVYHHLSDPAAIAAGLHLALRPGGRLVAIDFSTPDWLRVVRHGIPAEAVRSRVEGAGFRLERRIERWSVLDYGLVFRKPGS